MVRLSLVNLYLHGFADPHIAEYDTLTSQERWNEYADVVLANPPFMSPKDGIKPYSGVKTSILILDKSLAKKTSTIAFFKVENDCYGLGAQRREIDRNDLPQVLYEITEYLGYLRAGKSVNKFRSTLGLIVTKEKVAANGEYNLSGERYRDTTVANTDWSLVPLSEICEFRSGLWKGEKETLRVVKILRNTNFTKTGFLNLEDVAEHPVEIKQLESRLLRYGDIILEKSGGGPTQPVGRVALFNISSGEYSFSNFTARIRVADERADCLFIWLVLNHFYQIGKTEGLQKRTSGIRNLDNAAYQQLQFPLPSLEVQKEIVAEMEGYQKIIDCARAVIDNYRPHISIHSDWPMEEVGKICILNPPKSELTHLKGSTVVSFVPMADIGEHEMFFEPKATKRLNEVTTSYTYFKNGDVLIAKVTPCFENGKAGIARELYNGIGFGSSEYYVLRPLDIVLSEWIFICITTPAFRAWATPQMTGTGGLQRVPRAIIESYRIPLPPLSSQRAIVAEIESEQALVTANRELIARFEKKIQSTLARVWGEDQSSAV